MGLASRQFASLPTVDVNTLFLTMDANGVAGTAESLYTEMRTKIEAAGGARNNPRQIWICNDTAASIYLRGGEITAAATLQGVPVAPGEVLGLALEGEPADGLLYEAANDFTLALFY
jgi:hypothetical protein